MQWAVAIMHGSRGTHENRARWCFQGMISPRDMQWGHWHMIKGRLTRIDIKGNIGQYGDNGTDAKINPDVFLSCFQALKHKHPSQLEVLQEDFLRLPTLQACDSYGTTTRVDDLLKGLPQQQWKECEQLDV